MEPKLVFVHDGFNFDTFDNDICLIKLEHQVDMRVYTPVCVPSTGFDKDNSEVWITGDMFL